MPPCHVRLAACCAQSFSPKIAVGMRDMSVHLMSMPKASVYENYDAILTQHDVWCTRQPFHVFAVTVATRKEVTAHNPLWLCVSTPYLRHDGGTLLLAPNIHTFQFVITQK